MITSSVLGLVPFISCTDSTRVQMAAKQISQSLSHLNCQIPYIVSSNSHYIQTESGIGIKLARMDGEVLFNDYELFIIKYDDGELEFDSLPLYKKTHGEFCATLRYCIPRKSKFKKGQLLWEYDSFLNSIPVFGYNVFSAYFPFFGFTFEDSIVISENFANRANVNYFEKIYIPVYEHTIMTKKYQHIEGSYKFFPSLGQKLIDDIVCCYLVPKVGNEFTTKSLKQEIMKVLSKMSISDLLMSYESRNFDSKAEKTKISNGVLNGFRIHRLRNNVKLVDTELNDVLEKLFLKYGDFIVSVHGDLSNIFHPNYVNNLIKKYFFFTDKDKERLKINLVDCIYLLEFEIVSLDNPLQLGDKLTNRYAGKGVVSLIIPDDLRPKALQSNEYIDYIYNPMGVFSRMNVGQLIEGFIAKNVYYCDKEIRNNPENTLEVLNWLSNNIIQYLNLPEYFKKSKELIRSFSFDSSLLQSFIESVNQTNLYIYAPPFFHTPKDLIKIDISNEPVLIKKELLKYIRDKLKVSLPFSPIDIEIPNIFCVPIYVSRLYKIAEKLVNSRDYGPVRTITRQPSKGKSKSGGSKLGQMELEAILAHGCEQTLREIMTVKSDWEEGKHELLYQLVKTGEYVLPPKENIEGNTKKIINVLMDFLKN